MEASYLGVSLHHSLGGRPLWLVVGGARGGAAPQAAATIAGHRLTRLVAGWSGHTQLDATAWAYFVRANEVTVITTYAAGGDPQAAQTVGEAVRAALVDACGGKPADVTLAALTKRGLEVQLTARRAASGFGRVAGISHSKFDLATAQLSPDTEPEKAAADVRAANDPVAPGALASALEATATAVRKGDTLGASFMALRLPGYAVAAAPPPPAGQRLPVGSKRRSAGGRRGALLQLLPPDDADGAARRRDVHAPPPVTSPRAAAAWARRAGGGFGYDDDDESLRSSSSEEEDGGDDDDDDDDDDDESGTDEEEEEEDAGAASGESDSHHPAAAQAVVPALTKATAPAAPPSEPAAHAHSGSPPAATWQPTLQQQQQPQPAPPAAASSAAPPAPAPVTLPLRLAFLHSESVTLTASASGVEACSVEGSLLIKGTIESGAHHPLLPPSLLAAGHAPLLVAVRLRPAQPLVSLTYTPWAPPPPAAGALGPATTSGGAAEAPAGSPALPRSIAVSGAEPLLLQLTLPARPPQEQPPGGGGSGATPRGWGAGGQLELGSLHYKVAPSFTPQVLKAAASCKYTFVAAPAVAAAAAAAPVEGEGGEEEGRVPPQQRHQHRFTDVLVKLVVHPAVAAVTGAQLLVQLPPPTLKVLAPPPPGGGGGGSGGAGAPATTAPAAACAAYEPPQSKPPAQWNAQRGQLLWSVADGAAAAAGGSGGGGGAHAPSSSPPELPQLLAPGVPSEFKARVPVAGGLAVADPAPYGAIHGVPLQVRLTLPGTVLAPVVLEAAAAAVVAGADPVSGGGGGGGGGVSAVVTAVVSKAQSRLTATYKA